MKVRQVIRLLERDGWELAVIRGSHRQFTHPSKPGRVTVSGSLGDDMPKGTFAQSPRRRSLILLQADHGFRGKPIANSPEADR